jgi:glycerol-3-phosphate dehydrogenase
MVISRLRMPGDGDIIVPQRKFSIIGTTLRVVGDPDGLAATEDEIRFLLAAADELVEGFSGRKVRAAWAAARPLAGRNGDDGRSISRDIALFDHQSDGVRGFFSVVGGKATTLRIMGEIVADAVCLYAGIDAPCKTAEMELRPYRDYWRKA